LRRKIPFQNKELHKIQESVSEEMPKGIVGGWSKDKYAVKMYDVVKKHGKK